MKKLILLCALCLFGAGVVFGQAYSDLLYRDWAGLRAYAQVNKTLGDVPVSYTHLRAHET